MNDIKGTIAWELLSRSRVTLAPDRSFHVGDREIGHLYGEYLAVSK
jgi:hypothetical protein